VNYGGPLPEDANAFLARACPIVGSFGAQDRWNRGVAQRLEQTLTTACITHDVKEYPDAGHSFLNHHTAWWFKALRVIDIGYDAPAAEDARKRIVAFFKQHLSR
jgi:carboxymethylenebutenolidase